MACTSAVLLNLLSLHSLIRTPLHLFSKHTHHAYTRKNERKEGPKDMAAARCPFHVLVLLLACSCAAASADGDLIHLHFYFHEVDAGTPNATVVNVASLHRNASTFGDVNVFDNALREGPDPASRLIGRAQGLAAHTSLDESGGLTVINFVFSDHGEYSGSSLSTLGRISASGPSERSIVGGTGRLRLARGYMTSRLIGSTDTAIVVVFDMYFTMAY